MQYFTNNWYKLVVKTISGFTYNFLDFVLIVFRCEDTL